MAKRKPIAPTKTTVESAVNDAFNIIDELRDELQTWYDNLPESFQGGSKGDQLTEAIDQLEYDSEPDLPEGIGDAECSYLPPRKTRSRSERRDEAVAMIDGAIAAIDEKIGELEGNKDDASELDDLRSSLDDAKSNWENVEFPGMY